MKREPKIKFYTDKRKLWRWSAIAANGKTVADGAEGYATKAACLDGAAIASQSLCSDVDVQVVRAKLMLQKALDVNVRGSQHMEIARKKITRKRGGSSKPAKGKLRGK